MSSAAVSLVNSSLISDPHEDHANLHVPPADWPGDPCLHLNAKDIFTKMLTTNKIFPTKEFCKCYAMQT